MAYITIKNNHPTKDTLMTTPLRKTHKVLWILLAIIMPILIVFSIGSIKNVLLTDNDVIVNSTSGETLLENQQFTVSVHKTNRIQTLHIVLKTPLKNASSLVYSTPKDVLIGTLTKKGIYAFELPLGSNGIRIYDEIKETDILNIAL